MSIHVIDLVYKSELDDPTLVSVLLCLAEKGNHEGRDCFPSIPTLVRMSRFGERTVVRSLKELERMGWISVQRGVGKGNYSRYTINLDKLKRCQTATFSGPEKVPLKTRKGDFDDNPPHPLLGRTVHEPSIEPSIEPPREPHLPSNRHAGFKEALRRYWDAANAGREMPWGPAEGKQLQMLLAEMPHLALEEFESLLRYRFKSEVNQADRPSLWLRKVSSFGGGPIDRFGKPLNRHQPQAPSPTHQRVTANRKAIAAALERRGIDPSFLARGSDGGLLPQPALSLIPPGTPGGSESLAETLGPEAVAKAVSAWRKGGSPRNREALNRLPMTDSWKRIVWELIENRSPQVQPLEATA